MTLHTTFPVRSRYHSAVILGISAKRPPKVAVVVVTYNNLADTRLCLGSLRASAYPNADVIVVDNGSAEREDTPLGQEFGEFASAIRVAPNRGYASGANAGIRLALQGEARYVWLLNNDTIIRGDALSTLVRTLESDQGLGLVSPLILGSEHEDWSAEVWFAGGEVRLSRASAGHRLNLDLSEPTLPTDYVSGCAMLVRRELFEAIGLLDETMFLFWEDVDFSLRARQSGWRLAVVPRARVHHRVHGTIGRGSRSYLMARNGRIVAGRYATPRELVLLTAATVAKAARALPFAIRARDERRELLRGYSDGTRLMAIGALTRARRHIGIPVAGARPSTR